MDLLGLDSSTIANPQLRVCEVIISDHYWDVRAVRSLVNQEAIVQKIIGMPLSHSTTEDSFCWCSLDLVTLTQKLPRGGLITLFRPMTRNGHIIGFGN